MSWIERDELVLWIQEGWIIQLWSHKVRCASINLKVMSCRDKNVPWFVKVTLSVVVIFDHFRKFFESFQSSSGNEIIRL